MNQPAPAAPFRNPSLPPILFVAGVSTGEELGWPGWIQWWCEARWGQPVDGGDYEYDQVWRSPSIVLTGEDETPDPTIVEATIDGLWSRYQDDLEQRIRRLLRSEHHPSSTVEWEPATDEARLEHGAQVRLIGRPA